MCTSRVADEGEPGQPSAGCLVGEVDSVWNEEQTASEPDVFGTLSAALAPPAVSLIPTLDLSARLRRASAPIAELPEIPGYETLQVLGRGGMGVVYLAWQTRLARLVAVKMVLAGAHAEPEERTRFHTEAEAAARLQHPHIIQIYEVGEAQGRPYLAMEYVEGGSLAAWLNGKPQSWQTATAMIASLAGAVHHAHQRGIVHRDLKPANILLQPAEAAAVRADCPAELPTPKITDFGIAKLMVGGITQTRSGAILGTPGYMAPEQTTGASDDVGPAADIHALGAILYELLTGRPPFQAAAVWETIEQVRHQEPVSPRRLVPSIPLDLETICLKCLRKEPGRRYESALALLEDLRRCTAGEPIRARPLSAWERGVRRLRRHPAQVALFAVSCLAALALTGVAVDLSYSARLKALNVDLETAASNAESARAEAERQRAALGQMERWVRYVRDVHLADEAWQDGQVRRLVPLLNGCPDDLRGWEWRYLRGLANKDGRTLSHQAGVFTVAFAPGGDRLATGCVDGSVWLWDRARGTGQPVPEPHIGGVWSVAFSPDGRLLASGGEDRLVRLRIAESGRVVRVLRGHRGAIRCVAFSPDGKTLASGGKDGTIKLWDASSGRAVRSLPGHAAGVLALAFAPDGRHLASGGADRLVRLWDADTGAPVRSLEGHAEDVRGVAFRADGLVLASVGTDGTLRTWDPANGQSLAVRYPPNRTALTSVAFGPGGRIATAADNRTVCIWGESLLQTYRGHNHRVESVALSPDGKWAASASPDWTVKLWEIDRGQEYRAFPIQSERVLGATFSADGSRLIDAALDGTVRVWDTKSGKLLRRLGADLDRPRSVACSSDGRLVAAAGRKGLIHCYDLATGGAVPGAWQHDAPARAVVFSRDGRTLASTADDGSVKVWDVDDGQLRFTCPGHTAPVLAVAFSPDGRILASGGRDGVRLWDAVTGRQLPSLSEETPRVVALAFGPNSRLAVAQMGGNITLWDPDSGRRHQTLIGHSARVWSLAFTPDGTRLASASRDMTVKLWDPTRGQEVLTLRGFSSEVSGVTFSPDGSQLVTTDLSGAVRLWEAGRRQ